MFILRLGRARPLNEMVFGQSQRARGTDWPQPPKTISFFFAILSFFYSALSRSETFKLYFTLQKSKRSAQCSSSKLKELTLFTIDQHTNTDAVPSCSSDDDVEHSEIRREMKQKNKNKKILLATANAELAHTKCIHLGARG